MATIFGTPAADNLNGTDSNDSIFGLDGNDTLNGLAGDDRLFGGLGDDRLNAGGGNNSLYGEDGNDFLMAGSEAGNSSLYGGNDDDTLEGGYRDDNLYGGKGNDSLDGFYGSDRLFGEDGNDFLVGEFGNDTLNGGAGDDLLDGAWGPLYIAGPVSRGQNEIDVLTGGTGKDTFKLEGGSGRDGVGPSYRFAGNSDYALITDFNQSEDKISLRSTESGPAVYPPISINYSLGASPDGLPQGTAIFADNLGAKPELIAILQGVSPESLSLSQPYFNIIS